ncbi:hypothetical protein Tco_1314974 [Tanacetum coccineum]
MVNSLSRLGLPYNTTLENRRLAIELDGLVVNWERQRQNEMKIVNDGDGSSQNNDVSSITSNGADPKWLVDGPTLKVEPGLHTAATAAVRLTTTAPLLLPSIPPLPPPVLLLLLDITTTFSFNQLGSFIQASDLEEGHWTASSILWKEGLKYFVHGGVEDLKGFEGQWELGSRFNTSKKWWK